MSGRGRIAGLIGLVILGSAAAAGGYVFLQDAYESPGPAARTVRIEVASGASLRSVLNHLEAAGVLRRARAIEWYLRIKRTPLRVESGEYDIPAHASAQDILTLFAEGKVVLEQLTVVEGASFDDFLSALAAHPKITHTLRGRSPAQVMAALGHPGLAAEGEFFPDTYRFAAHTSDLTLLQQAYAAMQRALTAAWQERSPELPLQDPYQALILASMIEKEAALQSERGLIAAVFLNRLKRGMRLQSDPTVIYGLGGDYDGSIHSRDLARDTPYNTYTRVGLPPTPIALPGRESLLAAVQPQPTPALYFVASGLNDGAHHFSATLKEHNAAVQSYLARLRGASAPAGKHRP